MPIVYEDQYMQIFWDEQTRLIGIEWKEATSTMTDENFKTELTLFAQQVEDKKASRILIDVSKFRHRPDEEVGKWRMQNISTRYNAAGVRRFAFLVSPGSPISSGASQSQGEQFLTQTFNDREQATVWLKASD